MTGRAKTPLGRLTQGGAGKRRAPLTRGRVSKLTPEVSKKICDAVRAGNYIGVTARYCGVAESTLQQWIMRGRGEHPDRSAAKIYVDFVHDLDEAEAGAEIAAVLHWRAAMPKDWHASEKWLDKRVPQRWAAVPADQSRSAFAGVQVNIGLPGGPNAPETALTQPLQALLEANPELIAGTMQFLDQLLPVQEQIIEDIAPTAPDSPIVEAEPGSWRQVDTETE